MCSHIRSLYEPFTTQVTLVRPLASVNELVVKQRALLRKRLVTEGALKRLDADVNVIVMARQIDLTHKRFATDLTPKRLFPSVSPVMHRESLFPKKRPMTLVALVDDLLFGFESEAHFRPRLLVHAHVLI